MKANQKNKRPGKVKRKVTKAPQNVRTEATVQSNETLADLRSTECHLITLFGEGLRTVMLYTGKNTMDPADLYTVLDLCTGISGDIERLSAERVAIGKTIPNRLDVNDPDELTTALTIGQQLAGLLDQFSDLVEPRIIELGNITFKDEE